MKLYRAIALTLAMSLTFCNISIAQTSSEVIQQSVVLPDAPSATVETPSQEGMPPIKASLAPQSPREWSVDAGRKFWIANGVLLGSSILDAEMIARCAPSRCQFVPDVIRSRTALYGIGISASVALGYLSYQFKRSGNKWWYVPMAAVSAANFLYAGHSAYYGR
jgi:hypothetical protein